MFLSCLFPIVSLFLATACTTRSTHANSIPDDPSGNRRVLHIVIDGLTFRSLDALLSDNRLPNLARIKSEGASTDNARIDYDSSQTLPTHISMFTGLTVEEHGFKEDKDPGTSKAINGMDNIFDLVSDADGRTCFFGSKSKFAFFQHSKWNIDHFDYNKNGEDTVSAFKSEMEGNNPCVYALVHFREPDKAGHSDGPDDKEYRRAVEKADDLVGQVLATLEDTYMMDDTAVIVVTDHGFSIDDNHSDKSDKNVYTVPFFAKGPHIDAGADLYELNQDSPFADPGNSRPKNDAAKQPIRVHLSGVLAADFLGVSADSGPLARSNQLLKVSSGGAEDSPTLMPTSLASLTEVPAATPTTMAPSTEVPTATLTTLAPSPSPQEPSIQSFDAIGMTYINERRKSKAYGRNRMILNLVRRFRRSKQGLLQFDLSAERVKEIKKIELALTCTKGSSSGVTLFKTVQSNWKQSTVAWRNAPGKDEKIGGIQGETKSGETYKADLVGGAGLVDASGRVSIRLTTRSRKSTRFTNGRLIVTYS